VPDPAATTITATAGPGPSGGTGAEVMSDRVSSRNER
jgi:hypothetical protein